MYVTIRDHTSARKRDLPHLERSGKTYFLTFRTKNRWILPPAARDIAMECCLHDNQRTLWLDALVVMPDHVHMLITPYEHCGLPLIMTRIKNVSAHRINAELHRTGPVWQREYFDHILRSDESSRTKGEYIVMNPVRKGLVSAADGYRWTYRSWIEGDAAEVGGATLRGGTP